MFARTSGFKSRVPHLEGNGLGEVGLIYATVNRVGICTYFTLTANNAIAFECISVMVQWGLKFPVPHWETNPVGLGEVGLIYATVNRVGICTHFTLTPNNAIAFECISVMVEWGLKFRVPHWETNPVGLGEVGLIYATVNRVGICTYFTLTPNNAIAFECISVMVQWGLKFPVPHWETNPVGLGEVGLIYATVNRVGICTHFTLTPNNAIAFECISVMVQWGLKFPVPHWETNPVGLGEVGLIYATVNRVGICTYFTLTPNNAIAFECISVMVEWGLKFPVPHWETNPVGLGEVGLRCASPNLLKR